MARSEQPRRRFAPVPIETTFQTFRSNGGKQKHVLDDSQQPQRGRSQHHQQPPGTGPNAELTPEPSPRSPSPVPAALLRPRRRFAPQLIETSRRSRRVGDVGPATRPTDKTDITPYTKNIYTASLRHRHRRGDAPGDDESVPTRRNAPERRESEDEAVQQYLLELAAKEAERQMQEDALMAFPNSHAREGGVDHFYFRESSGSEGSPESSSPAADGSQQPLHHRRQSSTQGLNWWHKHMQEHAEHISHEHAIIDEDDDVDSMLVDDEAVESVPEAGLGAGDGDTVMRTDSDIDRMDFTAPPEPMWITTNQRQQSAAAKGPIGETLMPFMHADPFTTRRMREWSVDDGPPLPQHKEEAQPPAVQAPARASPQPVEAPYAKPGQIPPDTGFRKQASPFGRPFGGLGLQKPAVPKVKQVSPPMLGKDLVFRTCPSPKLTKLEPEHPFAERHAEERYRDLTGQRGLWRGYCFRSESNEDFLVPADLHGPPMLAAPSVPGGYDSSSYGSASMSDEPSPISGNSHGLHRLQGMGGNRIQRDKAAVELGKITAEFDDSFVTQVYNYLSLGYPATARAFDDELSRISLFSVVELERDDEKQLAQGHLVESEVEMNPEMRCPRWKALRLYIIEWARQHPDLDSMDPLGWGVRERRGSWAI